MLPADSRPAAATAGSLLNFAACSTRKAVARPPSVPSKSRSTRSRHLLHSRDFGRRCGLKQVALRHRVMDSSPQWPCDRCALVTASARKSDAGGDLAQVAARHCMLALPVATSMRRVVDQGHRTTECARTRSVHGTFVMLTCEYVFLPLENAVYRCTASSERHRSSGRFCHKVTVIGTVVVEFYSSTCH